MHKIDSYGATVSNTFTLGDPGSGTPATVVSADWMNAVQAEIVAVIESAGITLNKAVNNQLLSAITTLVGGGGGGPEVTKATNEVIDFIESQGLTVNNATVGQLEDALDALFVTKLTSLSNRMTTAEGTISGHTTTIGSHTTQIAARIPSTEKGAANGVVPLNASTKIDSTYLPSYVDDVLEVANYAALPGTGETGKIYVTIDTNYEYRWSGSAYIQLVASPGTTDAVPEGSTNKYFTDERAQDAVGALVQDSATIDATYNDAGNVESLAVIPAGIEIDSLAATTPLSVAKGGTGGATAIFAANTVGGLLLSRKTASFTAAPGYLYIVDTTAGAVTVTLPAVAGGGKIKIVDLALNFGTSNLIIAPATGEAIKGLAANATKTLSTSGDGIELYGDPVGGYWGYNQGGSGGLVPVAKTSSFSAVVNQKNLVDLTSATVIGTLPVTSGAAVCSFTEVKGLGSDLKWMEIAPGSGDSIDGNGVGDSEKFTYPFAHVTYYKAAGSNVWYGDYQIAAMSGSGSGGLTPVAATANVTSAANYTMYECDATAGAFTITLPTIPALGGVIGLMEAKSSTFSFTATKFVRLSATGSNTIDDGGVGDSFLLDYAGANVIAYAAPGATSWKLQKQATSTIAPGFQPGYTGSTAISAGNIGESIGTLRAGTGGNSRSVRGTVTLTISNQVLLTTTLKKGEYIVGYNVIAAWSLDGYVQGTTLKVGGTPVINGTTQASKAGLSMTGSAGPIPLSITVDDTIITVEGSWSGGIGTSTNNFHEMWIVRIA